MRKLLPLLIVLITGCHSKSDQVKQQLKDTLAKLRIKTDFRPLDSADAYSFINKYYLPKLDTTPTGRKIFIHPLNGMSFTKQIEIDSIMLSAKFNNDSAFLNKPIHLFPPPPLKTNTNSSWNSKRLINTTLITDAMELDRHSTSDLTAWRKKYGFGYMCISYPQYNPHTKRLIIKEYIENGDWCGTNREKQFSFKRVPRGWEAN
jgi:hypothetical protein